MRGQSYTCVNIELSCNSPTKKVEFQDVGNGSFFFFANELQRKVSPHLVICVHSGRVMPIPLIQQEVEIFASITIVA